MKIFILKMKFTDTDLSTALYKWLGKYVGNYHYTVTRLTIDTVKVGLSDNIKEDDLLAFKLRFGL